MAEFILTDEQIDHYHREGFLVLRQDEHHLIDPEHLQKYTSEVRNLPRENGKWMPYDEVTASGARQLMRTENFVDYHAGFAALLHGPALTRILAQLNHDDDMLLFKDKINYKLPGGNGFGAHLDAPAYDHIGEIEHTTANLAVDAATLENGCVEVVPGSHLLKDIPFAQGGAITDEWIAQQTWLPVPLQSGDLLLFGSHLAHKSGPNRTAKSRASVYATYHRRSDGEGLRDRYYADRREHFPPDHERVVGKDYERGVARYAFAAPFTAIEERKGMAVA